MNASQDYQLVRRLGTGAAGTVYLAKTETGEVAIRQFESQADAESTAWRRERDHFLDAGRKGAGLSNPRIVTVREVIDEAGEAFVVMDYISASTLATALQGGRRFTPEETDSILVQVATALDFAHDRGVVHGDLKPADVFLAQKGAMISDFAISPRAGRDVGGPVPTSLVHGYLSPEHLRDTAEIGPRSDQYSLAVMAYQMYTGRSPYGDAISDMPQAIVSARVIPPSQVDRQLPSSIDAPLLRALSRDPNQRFATCRELAAMLGAGLITHPIVERRRIPTLIYVLAPALLVLLLALMWFSRKPDAPVSKPVTTTGVAPASMPGGPPAPQNPPGEPQGTKPATSSNSSKGKTQPVKLLQPVPAPGVVKAAPKKPDPPPPAVDAAVLPSSAADLNPHFSIDVLSRGTHRIESGSSFPLLDPQLGELAQGDLAALVSYEGRNPPRDLHLEWSLDGVVADSKPVILKAGTRAGQVMVAYTNEPSAGSYRISLKQKNHTIQTFTFRITQ